MVRRGRAWIAVEIRCIVDADVSAERGVERGAAEAELSLLERGASCETGEEDEEDA